MAYLYAHYTIALTLIRYINISKQSHLYSFRQVIHLCKLVNFWLFFNNAGATSFQPRLKRHIILFKFKFDTYS